MWRFLVELAIVVNAIAATSGLLLRRRRRRRELDHEQYVSRILEQNKELDELIEKQRGGDGA
jgi:hypothetical protein